MTLGTVKVGQEIYFDVVINSTFPAELTGKIPLSIEVFNVDSGRPDLAAQLLTYLTSIPSGTSRVSVGDQASEVVKVISTYAKKGPDGLLVITKAGKYEIKAYISGEAECEGHKVSISSNWYTNTFNVESVAPSGKVEISNVYLKVKTASGGGTSSRTPTHPIVSY